MLASPYQILLKAMPNATDNQIFHIIWSRTSYPFGKVSARDLVKAAYRYQRAFNNGLMLCDHCDRLATKFCMCDVCRTALERARNLT